MSSSTGSHHDSTAIVHHVLVVIPSVAEESPGAIAEAFRLEDAEGETERDSSATLGMTR
jgi:hypothetical protein